MCKLTELPCLFTCVLSPWQRIHQPYSSHMTTRKQELEHVNHLPQLISPGQDTLPAYSEKELCDEQLNNRTISRVLFYVERQRRPSKSERARETVTAIRHLKSWEKLVVSNDILYRVSRDQISKTKWFQYVVPESLKAKVLKDVHDHAGHQGQFNCLS